MRYQNRRYLTLIELWQSICKPLTEDITTDYVIIGGGVAGLHAAKYLSEQWLQVTLIEKNICGGGMSWRSGWFLTPDSELWLRQMEQIYGRECAHKLRDFGEAGQQDIVTNIKDLNLWCDLKNDDSLLLGLGTSWAKDVEAEYNIRCSFGFASDLINQQELRQQNTANCYTKAVRYKNCYAIDPAQYCQSLKAHLITQWVRVYEFSEIKKIESHKISTNQWSVTFKKSIRCIGKTDPKLDTHKAQNTYGIMNYLTISEPLNECQIRDLMPLGNCMCRDTQLVFNYYRITGDNRLLLGWGNPFNSFQPFEVYQDQSIKAVIRDIRRAFPSLSNIHFENYRTWRIEATKDLMPMIGADITHPNHHWVQGCVWLPWAAASGVHAAQQVLAEPSDADLDRIFDPQRKFMIPLQTNNFILKPIIFGLSNAKAMFS